LRIIASSTLVLDVFDVEGAAARLPAHQRIDHALGQRRDLFAHARGGGALPAVDGDERLGHRNGDFRRLKADDGAVAADDLGTARTPPPVPRLRWLTLTCGVGAGLGGIRR